MMIKLSIKPRDPKASLAKMRAEGFMPAVMYGKHAQSTPIMVSKDEFKKVWKEAGESTVLTLTGLEDDEEALIHDIDLHPVTDDPRHADFYVIQKGQTLQVTVPLEFEGEPKALETYECMLVKVMHEVEVEATAANLPQEIKVDVSHLAEIGAQITIADLKLPQGVTVLAEPTEVVALIDEIHEEEEEAPAEIDLESIEVEGKGKEEGEGEGETGEAAKEE